MELDKKVQNNFDQSGITIPCNVASLYLPATYFLEVGARVLLKVEVKNFRGKKNTENLDFSVVFVNEKRRSAA